MEDEQRKLNKLALWLDEQPRSGPWNMALDEALLEYARLPVLRVYRWSSAAVSAGIRFKLSELDDVQLPVVKRMTGGGLVWHDGDVTFTLVVPEGDDLSRLGPREIYHWLHGHLAAELTATTGREHHLVTPDEAADGPRCFDAPVEHDVVHQGRKVAGGAQRRSRRGFLHQGSMRPARHDGDFWQRLAARLAHEVVPYVPDAQIMHTAEHLLHTRYLLPDWSRS